VRRRDRSRIGRRHNAGEADVCDAYDHETGARPPARLPVVADATRAGYDVAMGATSSAAGASVVASPAVEVRAARPFTGTLALLIGVVAVIVLAVQWPATSARADYFDDGLYLGHNRLVQNPSWSSIGQFLSEVWKPSTVSGYYQPLTMISLSLDSAMGGRPDNPVPYHCTSLALHVLDTALVILLLYLLLGNAWAAAVVGLLFGVHPLAVEPIPWTGERKTLLAAFFALWCLVLYVLYVQRGRRLFYGLSLLMLVLALLSKPTTVPVPLLLLILDWWPLRRVSWRALIEKIPFFAIAGLAAVVTVISQARACIITLPQEQPASKIPLTICHNIIFYPYKMLWPTKLTYSYVCPDPLLLSQPLVLAGVIGTAILLVLLLLSLRWTRALWAGWVFFFVAIFPTMGVIGFTNVIASHKYAYLPVVGFLLILTWFLIAMGSALQRSARARIWLGGGIVAAVALVALEIRLTREQLGYWQSSESLYRYMLTLDPGQDGLETGLGYALFQQGHIDESIAMYRTAIGHNPRYAISHNNLGTALGTQGKFAAAAEEFRKVIDLTPRSPVGYSNLARALARQGQNDEARKYYEQSLTVDPYAADALNGLGVLLATQGKLDEAAGYFREAIRANPSFVNAYVGLGLTLTHQERIGEAVRVLEEARDLAPTDKNVANALTAALNKRLNSAGP
jgi:tetratricopeptide (TPR) repeat protein